MKKFLTIVCCLSMLVSMFTVQAFAVSPDAEITNSNYDAYLDGLEKELNGDNVISSTTKEDYKFGQYGRVHFDGWYVKVTDCLIDGLKIKLTIVADEGYTLPDALPDKPSRNDPNITFPQTPRIIGTTGRSGDTRYTLNNDGSATLEFLAKDLAYEKQGFGAAQDQYYSVPVLAYAVAIKDGENTNTYLKDYVFVNVEHRAAAHGYLGYEESIDGIDFRMDGSRTYLTKKNSTLRVYTRQQDGFAPMEVEYNVNPIVTGVTDSRDATDYRNRYIVFNVGPNSISSKEVMYQPTYFTVNVYDYTANAWVRVGAYDYYHNDNNINIAELVGDRFQLNGRRITGFNAQTYVYDKTMSQVRTRTMTSEEVSLDYTVNTKASDFNIQWTNTGVDKINGSRDSSLRLRQGDVYITPRYTNEYTVSFVDYNNNVLKTESVLAGQDASAPEEPSREGYLFTGWDSEFTNVQSDLTVIAQYQEIPAAETFTVTFIDYDGRVISRQEVISGADAAAPANPTRNGYLFTGWDSEFTNVQSDLTITAEYEAEEVDEPVNPPTPPTPTTPPTSTPPVTIIAPPLPTVTVAPAPTGTATIIPDPETPLAGGETEPVQIDDPQVPMANAGSGSWALVNLISTVLTVLFGIVILLGKLKKQEEAENEEEVNELKRRKWTKVIGVILAIVSVIVFFVTEDMSMPMVMTDKWTLLMVVMAVINLVVLAVGRKFKQDDDKDQGLQRA